MQQARILFTFGTLYEPQIITALLDHEPKYFSARLKNYAVFQGTKEDLSEEMQEDIGKKHNLDTFVFLFANKVPMDLHSQITGKAYYINSRDEDILDLWERYPQWYSKEVVEIENELGDTFHAIVYVQDKKGKIMREFKRNPYDLDIMIENARKLRERSSRD